MNSVNSVTRAFGLIAIYHYDFLSESSQQPDLTKHLSLRTVFLWDLVQGNAVSDRRETVLLQVTEGSVSVSNTAPLRARWPPHLLPMGYANSPSCSFILWSEDSRWAVDLLLCTSVIDYVNVLNSSQTGLKWQHSDFFPSSLLFTVFLNITSCIGGWVLLLFPKFLGNSAFSSACLFFSFTNT